MYNSFREINSKKKFLFNVIDYDEVEIYNCFLFKTATRDEYEKCIYFLSDFMYRYYNIKPIILIDEYDVPIQNGFLNNFYDETMELI